jgi:Rhodopirellula transposase DDE domain
MDEEIKWTNLTRQEIANLLAEKGIDISVTVVDQLLALHSFRRRQAVKAKACGTSENRNEHRLFPHLSRACKGVIFQSVNTVSKFMATATTQKGLQVFTTIIDKTYQTGKKVAQDFKEKMEIFFDDFLPQWNYTAKPQSHLEL